MRKGITHGYAYLLKMAPKPPQIFITFLIHIDVLELCRKFEVTPTLIFQVTTILRNRPKFEKYSRL